ncbi:hypothetical protein [Amycolatopsis sp. lyj-109]|uniref:hypothetical protein n=1 Tax=Amycolatopsis sp. lyj-109 TaxID=2789287 RepID=UPI00397BB746
MSIPCLAQREDQQRLEWSGGSVFSVLLDAEANGGQLTVGRFDVSEAFGITPQLPAEAAEPAGNVVLGPPR